MAPHSSLPSTPVSDLKAELRRGALARRDVLGADERSAAAARIAETVLAIPGLAEAPIVGAFWPIRSEVDPRPIIEGLFARGQRVALPKVTSDGLVFREWRAGEALVAGTFGLSEPRDDLPPLDPTALIVPLAAFDRRGQRIGYGRGYYDQAIERLSRNGPVLTIGIAFAVQEIEHVPAEPHDRPLDHMVTEAGIVPLARG
ncbi:MULTISPECIES: 5-formyltetrahydrofolate cyclo-ligase [Methylobacterium]|uniref:5-formyltetrahydrofolate cyclo-ligase n=2 Tax=Pseudomonadota TaxID=1224 RepID=A0ABQ4T053_9HYPH|nr:MULTISPECIES: 5-formyltetrahydrofolate cyclo-ligase [Methylobacterium]PIU04326.1 MAG: 5-formyltetrahydrofolate cyclo-ligase [Methylobacterium sp. CG09_land_8_20_14_0_10_71_15]PIU12448.1 MAG: 5-formyltetrahydrofolate cyclo-ligase [Methylobacterium sp. CG08_land_8_20_14_0_20_71_15]GBU19769.1 5-formyltetrahydrofolate cyclo-ligase [Methylobacterium sp.]GJE08834.1 5-formyltetrahydrofolate cyclo-ligase [Methylobacterium jeotgali]